MRQIINGVIVNLSSEQEDSINQFWDFNIQYPDFKDAIIFNFSNPPEFDIEKAKEIASNIFNKRKSLALIDVNDEIQLAQDNDISTADLITKRKSIRNASVDLSECTDMQDIKLCLNSAEENF